MSFFLQIWAVLYRRIVIHKRSKAQLTRSIITSLFTSLVSLYVQWKINQNDKLKTSPYSFQTYAVRREAFAVIADNITREQDFTMNLILDTKNLILQETKIKPHQLDFYNSRDFDNWIYDQSVGGKQFPQYHNTELIFAFEVRYDEKSRTPFQVTVYHNSSDTAPSKAAYHMSRLLYKRLLNNSNADIKISHTRLGRHYTRDLAASTSPAFITFGVINICILFISQAIEDLCTERRPYMILCGLSKFAYWIGCFIADFIVWAFIASCFWLIYYYAQTPIFYDHPLTSFIIMIGTGPGLIMLVYCLAFVFDSQDSASNYAYFILMVPFIILSGGTQITQNEKFNKLLEKAELVYPVTDLFILLFYIGDDQFNQKYLYSLPANFVLYAIALIIIEIAIKQAEKSQASFNFSFYADEFKKRREKHVSIGAKEHEKDVKKNKDKYILKCIDVCRLFFTSKRHALPAVNNVTIGVKRGETFGLLGANGAGKTTLMKMIYGRIPYSKGEITMNGKPIKNGMIAYCPQFDDHLSPDLTGRENLKFYSLIFGMSSAEFNKMFPNILRYLDLAEHVDKVFSEMSGGNQRKVSIAVALLSSSSLVMFDEPTSSLDPVARHNVHQLLTNFKGKKTFVLCTHLLNEAESLCDDIAIMIKGCVYTYGSPQLLANYFGKEWKIDVLMETQDMSNSVDAFIKENLPTAHLTFERQRTRIYLVPCDSFSLAQVFDIMQKGVDEKCGISYYTCSSSTLEKVFMELVKMAETGHETLLKVDKKRKA